jgi:hypothetical protein
MRNTENCIIEDVTVPNRIMEEAFANEQILSGKELNEFSSNHGSADDRYYRKLS